MHNKFNINLYTIEINTLFNIRINFADTSYTNLIEQRDHKNWCTQIQDGDRPPHEQKTSTRIAIKAIWKGCGVKSISNPEMKSTGATYCCPGA